MKKYISISSVLLLGFAVSSLANASLIVRDWKAAGDNALTLDTATKLEWLDLTYTAGMSYKQVSSALSPAGAFGGFRYATVNDVTTLFSDAGIPDIGLRTAANYTPVNNLLGLEGKLVSLAGGGWSHAITGTPAGPNEQYYSVLQLVLGSPPFVGIALPGICCVATNAVSPDTGSWLVRPMSVSEPPTFLLVGLVSVLLPAYFRSRRAAGLMG